MSSTKARSYIFTLATLAALFGPATYALEAEEPADLLHKDWYVTEIIIVQRPPVMEFSSTEQLLRERPPALPLNMRTFPTDSDNPGEGLDLDLLTRLNLVYPTLELLPPDDDPVDADVEPVSMSPPLIEPVLESDPLLDVLTMAALLEEQLESRSYRPIPAEALRMSASADQLARRGGFQVLYHGGWLQPVPPREAPEYFLLQAGARVADRYQLEGVVAVTLGRYLHFQTSLSYTEPGMGLEPMELALKPDGSSTPARTAVETHPVMTMAESRRMRSEEVHYLDHPKLGIIVRIDAVPIPDTLAGAFDALKEGAE